MDFATMMTLEPHGPDTYVGIGPKYPWGGLYGGQIVAQALRAAAATVDPDFRVALVARVLHPSRRPRRADPVRGRSHPQRPLVRDENGRRPPVGRRHLQHVRQLPGRRARAGHADRGRCRRCRARTSSTRRGGPPCSSAASCRRRGEPGRALAWLRMNDPIVDDPVLHACALAYLSDDLPTDAVVAVQHPELAGQWGDDFEHTFWSASLDHAIWFHRAVAGRRLAVAGVHVPRPDELTRPVRRPRLRPRPERTWPPSARRSSSARCAPR